MLGQVILAARQIIHVLRSLSVPNCNFFVAALWSM